MKTKAETLRRRLQAGPIVRVMGAHNGLGAKLIEEAGFDGVWASGLEISTSFAVPDANILTMTENLAAARAMNDATSLPVVCDCDTGFGNASNVIHMVKKFEAAGIAGIVIEDKVFPKVNSFVPGRQELAPIQEFMGKIEAAKEAQSSSDFMVFARVEALIAGWGMEEALKRAQSYEKAGADGIVIHSKAVTADEVFTFAKTWKGKIPLVVIPTTFYSITAEEFSKNGFKMVIYANQALRAAISAVQTTLASIESTGSTAAVENKIASMKEVFRLQGMYDMKEDEEKFTKSDSAQAIIPAAGEHRPQTGLGLGEALKNKPLCMLEIGGKKLIDHQMDALRSCGVKDIRVVTGHMADKIKLDGAAAVHNVKFSETSNAYSILLTRPTWKNKAVMVFSDIIFDRWILEGLLESPHAITLVIDRAYRALPYREKKLDLVVAEDTDGAGGGRRLGVNPFKPIRRIGYKIPKEEANYEFIGMAYFNKEGLRELSSAWDLLPNAEKADFNDLIQFILDRGFPVHGMEIEHGWSEIHSQEDWQRVNSHFVKNHSQIPLSTS